MRSRSGEASMATSVEFAFSFGASVLFFGSHMSLVLPSFGSNGNDSKQQQRIST